VEPLADLLVESLVAVALEPTPAVAALLASPTALPASLVADSNRSVRRDLLAVLAVLAPLVAPLVVPLVAPLVVLLVAPLVVLLVVLRAGHLERRRVASAADTSVDPPA